MALLAIVAGYAPALVAVGRAAVVDPRCTDTGRALAWPLSAMPHYLTGALVRAGILPEGLVDRGSTAVTRYVEERPELARCLVHMGLGVPSVISNGAHELAENGAAAVRARLAALRPEERQLLAALAPTLVSALPGVPFDMRMTASRVRLIAAAADGSAQLRSVARRLLDEGRKLLYVDPYASGGKGAWAELVGSIDSRTRYIGVLVAGGSATLVGDNLERYHRRADAFVDEGRGSLAMVVWAAGEFPSGWIEEAHTSWDGPLARALASFSHDLRQELTEAAGDHEVKVTVAGHSYGGAVVSTAELLGLDADRILHIASAGMGAGVHGPWDYPAPHRPRFSLTAPGDWISYVQGLGVGNWLGHGPDPDDFDGVARLDAGRLPVDPEARDEVGQRLGSRAGMPIRGRASHSYIFVRHSDAWWQIFDVFTAYPFTGRVLDGKCPAQPVQVAGCS